MDFLNQLEQLVGMAPAPGTTQATLDQAKARSRNYSAADEQRARAAGFPNADAMDLFMRQRNQHREVQTVAKGDAPGPQGKPSMAAAMGAHPAGLLQQVADAIKAATGQK